MTDINLEIARLVQYGVKKGLLHQETPCSPSTGYWPC